MIKVYIGETEVLSNKTFTITEELLKTSSTILNNCYPKCWEATRDYTNRFFFPKDYSQCKIQDEEYFPNIPGITVSSQNASLTLTNVDTTKLYELTNIDGNTTQSGTPTPDSPIPVNVVSGRQEVVVAGKNLLNNSTFEKGRLDNGVIGYASNTTSLETTDNSITFTTNANWRGIVSDYIKITPGETYTFNCNNNGNIVLNVDGYDKNKNWLSRISANTIGENISKEITETTNVYYLRISFQLSTGSTKTLSNLMIYKGNPATTYEEYKGNTYNINLGKNLLQLNNATASKNGVDGEFNNGVITVNGLNTSQTAYALIAQTINLPQLQKGETYTLSSTIPQNQLYIQLNYSDGSQQKRLGKIENNATSITFTVPNDYVNTANFFIGVNGTTTNVDLSFNVMLEEGSVSTTYAPYKTPIELCKIGNYQDFIKKGTGKNLCQTETNNSIISTLQAGTYTFSLYSTISGGFNLKKTNGSGENITSTQYISANNRTSVSFTLTEETQVFINGYSGTSGTTFIDGTNRWQLETGSTATSYEPYGMYNKWYIEKQTSKVVLNGTEEGWNVRQGSNPNLYIFYLRNNAVADGKKESGGFSNYFIENTTSGLIQYDGGFRITEYNAVNIVFLCVNSSIATTVNNFKNWLSTHNTELYYPLATPTYTEITDSELISQLNSLELLEGLNNISITSGDLPGEITIHYNYQEEHTDIDLLFCGVVKNSGDISLRPTDPKFCSLQILDYKALLSEGQSLDFVISNKTIEEAINMIIDAISDYGFIVGNISLSNGDETIGSYSTLNKTPYDVFQYLADISQSKWFTRVIDEDTVAIDFYSPELMERANDIQYTEEYFRENNIIDLSFSFGTRDYRNKQTILSDKVYGEIESDENITANGYQTSYETSGVIGILNHIYVNGVEKTIGTATEKNLGIYADFYYTPGNSTIEASNNYIAGTTIRALYTPLVKGRQIVYNNSEINRINNQTGRNGIIARYETRNDILSSNELNQVAQTYIQYKGTPEIILTVQTKDKDLFNIGQQVYFDMPDVPDLSTDYMVKNKEIEITKTGESGVVFYTYQLSSNYNSETAINYFDNQRNKTNGNISEDEFITRNIDIESTTNIIFDNLSVEEITIDGNNTLNCVLNSPFTQ